MYSVQQSEEIVCRTTGMMSLRKEASSPMKSQCSSADGSDQFLSSDWNPLVSVDRNVDFNVSSGLSSYYVTVPPIQGEQFQSSPSIPEVVSSTGLLKNSQFSSAPNFQLDSNRGIEKNLKGKKRKCVFNPGFPMEILPMEKQSDVSLESMKNLTKKDEKKHETENAGGTNQEECSQGGDAPKEDYIHIRAKRGQATNSHSLAERVRREKISERMKLLQDLVPGCNKINGKAMMLDEIINYVQSLQRQVEFLSMKLSAVNPELPFDIEQIFSKDILHSREASLAIFGCGASRAHFPQPGIMQQEMVMCNMPNSVDMMRSTFPQVSPMPQLSSVWDDELQTVLQMGFIPNQSLAITDPNDTMKTDE